MVGGAGYTRDPITAQGVTDAFRNTELCASAIDESLDGRRPFEVAMAAYQSAFPLWCPAGTRRRSRRWPIKWWTPTPTYTTSRATYSLSV